MMHDCQINYVENESAQSKIQFCLSLTQIISLISIIRPCSSTMLLFYCIKARSTCGSKNVTVHVLVMASAML